MSNSNTYREISKDDYHPPSNRPILVNDLQVGCLQRIADATELIAQNYVQLLQRIELEKEKAEKYYQWFQEEQAKTERLQRSITAHKANYTRLKRKMGATNDKI